MKKARQQIKTILKHIFSSAPLLTVFNVLIVLIRGVLPLLLIYLVKLTVDELQAVISMPQGEEDYSRLLIVLILAGVLFLINSLSASLASLVREKQAFAISDFFDKIIHNKTTSLSYSFFEFPKYQNIFYRALNEASHRPARVFYGILGIFQNSITLLAMGGILLTVHWSVLAVLLIIVVPIAAIRLRYAKKMFHFKRENTVHERKVSYYNRLLTAPEFAKELRVFDLGNYFRKKYYSLKISWRQAQYKLLVDKTKKETTVQIFAAVAFFAVYGFIAFKAYNHQISIGDVVLYFLAMQRGYSYLQELLSRMTGLYEDSLFLDNLFEFLKLEDDKNEIHSHKKLIFPRPIQKGIIFHNVGFHYPANQKWVIRNMNFTINAGETVAIVGINGAGKTTLVKLLCGLYQPIEGEILIDDTPLSQIKNSEMNANISVIFQDFTLYNVTARENILFGNVHNETDDNSIYEAAQKAGIDQIIEDFPQKYNTTLGFLFDGSEQMSPGEWQRLALARSFYNDSQIIILDEPTSALDSFAEAKLLKYIRSITSKRTSLIISHRISTIKMADKIVVLDGQKIAQTGTFEELVNKEGIFSKMMTLK
ncbi:MAG: ABC transporter ATP-binding protein/permease [Marinilabiliaceae bacterium]|nr:ABC transporter ATP-binding protein/permease [Marinilabiliaceae bacterium]